MEKVFGSQKCLLEEQLKIGPVWTLFKGNKTKNKTSKYTAAF